MNAFANRRLTKDAYRFQDQFVSDLRKRLDARTQDVITKVRNAHVINDDLNRGWYLDAAGVGHGATNGRFELEKAPELGAPRTIEEEVLR